MTLFTKDKTQQEILREQYLKEMNTSTVHTNGVRINEKLRGRLERIRENIIEESIYKPTFQSSTSRPIDYGNDIAAWMNAVREEAKKLSEINNNTEVILKIVA